MTTTPEHSDRTLSELLPDLGPNLLTVVADPLYRRDHDAQRRLFAWATAQPGVQVMPGIADHDVHVSVRTADGHRIDLWLDCEAIINLDTDLDSEVAA